MKRIKLVIAYDGTAYCGWQLQKNGVSVQQRVEEAILELTGEPARLLGASRTDAGVHARANTAVFDTSTRIPAQKLAIALNQHLPDDIAVQSSCEVDAGFDPHRANMIKTYEYRILCSQVPDPLWRLYCYQVHWPLDAESMRRAAEVLLGEHDFASFCSAGSAAEDTVRRITELGVSEDGPFVLIRVSGDGFLYNMVRIIAGTLIAVGRGALTAGQVEDILYACDRRAAGIKAPAKGLTLIGSQPFTPAPLERLADKRIDYTILRASGDGAFYMAVHSFRDNAELYRMAVRTARHAFWDNASSLMVHCEAPDVLSGLGTYSQAERDIPGIGTIAGWREIKDLPDPNVIP